MVNFHQICLSVQDNLLRILNQIWMLIQPKFSVDFDETSPG